VVLCRGGTSVRSPRSSRARRTRAGLSQGVIGGSCGPVSTEMSTVFKTIENSGARLLHLVNTLLDSSSLRQGTFSLSMETVCLQSVVIESMQVCRMLLVEQGPPCLLDSAWMHTKSKWAFGHVSAAARCLFVDCWSVFPVFPYFPCRGGT
jgi:hypothetical protein